MKKYMNKKDFVEGWRSGLPETPCGRGSRMADTKIQREWIPEVVEKYGIESIADIGCGDLNWASRTEFGCDYAPYDLIPRAQGVTEFDLLTDELPEADCLMVLWVMNHMSPSNQRKAMKKLIESSARYLIITFDSRLESIIDHKYIDHVVIRHDRGVDSEIRLIELGKKVTKKKVAKKSKK